MLPALCDKNLCTGCGACANKCPRSAISLLPNREGFPEPVVNGQCRSCSLCTRACPVLFPPDHYRSEKPSGVFACWSLDETVRRESSSGGIFSVIAEHVLSQNGIVFGAAWDTHLCVRHIAADTVAGLASLRKSKYVQSSIGESYRQAEHFLKQHRPVMFAGTPCQIAGLYAFLGKQYDRLLTCDFICHGVPSPAVLEHFLSSRRQPVAAVVHRTKNSCREHWVTYFTEWTFAGGKRCIVDDSFIHGFLTDLFNRHCCMNCQYAEIRRMGDFTLGDFWGLGAKVPFSQPVQKGVSLVMVNSEKARPVFDAVKERIFYEERSLEEAIAGNQRLVSPSGEHPLRNTFFRDFAAGMPFEQLERKFLRKPWQERLSAALQIYLGMPRYAALRKLLAGLLKRR
ncbi:MAG: Coenzyme F420 hydrogenase/dehydrogenase, beta subunit C-terminal domain [Planctomycetaceae bacterium]|jgi:coenzyme F420-reducing hydrogenase beta subunit|nr:Coenzyme F420 hydrogenase/dehydrogenase, beta subunit C-terminal domain [Planctomycetaceae bacterium]